nr:MAG TPA: Protein of unknown function (DUF1653) [Bacteriophage sp.]DAK36837.1 MAG TPA: Protein of unknown function (DUF1653) [Caudoviricetes sp.]
MTEFRFNEDFANNWKSGQTVTCEEKEDGYLVDKVALIEKDELLKHGEFITMNVEILGHMQSNGVFMYNRDFKPGDTVQHFKGGFYKIVTIGTNTETEEKMVVYQSLKDQRVWIRPYDMFISKVDREKYPNDYQPYRLIKVKITA